MPKPTKLDYVSLIEEARKAHNLSIAKLAASAKMNASRLGLVLNRKAHLTREQAYFIGLVLQLRAVEMEHLALLVVYATATRARFRKHILEKIERIRTIRGHFSWSEYIQATLDKNNK